MIVMIRIEVIGAMTMREIRSDDDNDIAIVDSVLDGDYGNGKGVDDDDDDTFASNHHY